MLVVDVCTLLREGIAAICQATGRFEVVGHCGDGAAAVRLIRSLDPAIALVDLDLPGLDWPGIVRQSRGFRCKFLCCSLRKDRKAVLQALRTGASGFVLKSDPAAQLLSALQQVWAGSIYVSPELELADLVVPRRGAGGAQGIETLSPREYQVFSLLVDGIRAKEIAARLGLSPKTVNTYRSSLMKKLDVQHLAGLVKFAVDKNLTSIL